MTIDTKQPGPDSPPARVAIVTLGCGRNEVDSDQLAGLLETRFEVTSDATTSDVVLVNTCTFIEPAKQESIDTILAAADLKEGRARGVVVIGCMAQRYPEQLSESLPEADAIVGFAGYPQLPDLIDDLLDGRDHERVVGIEESRAPSVLPGRSLPMLDVTQAVPETGSTTDSGSGLSSGLAQPAVTGAGSGATWLAPIPELPGRADDADVIEPLAPGRVALVDPSRAPASGPVFPPRRSTDAPWAHLKIASGCDRLCTFCAIPSFRGRFRSRPIDELVAEAAWLADQGVRELVLVSENTTSYGKDLPGHDGRPGGRGLAVTMLEELAQVDGIERLRAMYLQPAELREDLIEAIASIPQVASYFDLSLQHVSASVLRRMARSGSPARFGDLVGRIRALAPDAAIRSNFILGFPGETPDDVAALATFLDTHELDFVGLFTYSDEDGTAAVDLGDHVPSRVAAERLEEVAGVVERASDRRAQARVGDRVTVIVERMDEDGVVGRSHREAPESDGEVELVDGESMAAASRGAPVRTAIGNVVSARVVEAVGVDLVATPLLDDVAVADVRS